MGQAILYCFRCSTQLREVQFEQRKAYRIDSWVCCAACAPEALKELSPVQAQALLKALANPEKKAAPPPAGPRRESTPRIPTAPPESPKSNRWILGAAAAVVVVAILLLLVFSGKPTPEPPPEAPVAPRKVPPPPVHVGTPHPPPPPSTDSPERQALLKARKYAQDHPDDLEGQLREYGDLTLLADKTELGTEARKAVETLTARQRFAVERGMEAVEKEIDGPLRSGDYGEVLKKLEAASSRIPGAQWKLALEKREGSVREEIFKAFEGLKEKYREARTRGDGATADGLAARVRSWGLERLTSDLARIAVEVAPPAEPSRSAEGKAYDAQRDKAMLRAAIRDYAGAAADLERAGAALKEEAIRKEFTDDLRDLKELDRLYPAAIAAQAAFRTLHLRTVEEQSVSGRVYSIDADRVELQADPLKPTVFLEWVDVHVSSMLKAQGADDRILALADRLDALPRTKPAPEELQARELYYDAERQFRSMATREKAIEAYRQLKQKYKETMLVKRALARIDRRSEAGKEYYFIGVDLTFSGSFSLTKEGRLESMAESDPAQANRNFVEAEFHPLPNATYRCWALLGGCCPETFTCFYQATGLTEVSPKTRKRAPADPGSDLASPVKHSLRNLKSHPKSEHKISRWEWVELVLPKPATPGTRKIRLLTDQQGFGVGAMVVSSARTKAPTDAETAELAKTRSLDAPPPWALVRSGAGPRLLIDDFSQGIAGWGFHPGTEFPGAKGGQSYDTAAGRDGKGSLKISADFSGGGAYVSTARTLPSGTDAKEVRFWIRTDSAGSFGVRIGDSADQCHQHPLPLKPTKEWQEIVLNFEKLVGREHWGGANDGKLHGPVKWFALCFSKATFGGSGSGEVWIDDVEAILNVADR